MIYTISDLQAGRVAVVNDGTQRDLKIVLKEAFPNDPQITAAVYRYYFKQVGHEGLWDCDDETHLPTQSVSLFSLREEQQERVFTLEELEQAYTAGWMRQSSKRVVWEEWEKYLQSISKK